MMNCGMKCGIRFLQAAEDEVDKDREIDEE